MKAITFPDLMEDQLNTGFATVFNSTTYLQKLVNYLVGNSLKTIIRNKTVVVNEVPAEFSTGADAEKIAPVISALLTTVIANSRNGLINITVDKFRDIVTLEIQDRNNYNGYALACGIKAIEPLASIMGCSINIEAPQQLIATVSFSFPDRPDKNNYDNW